VDVLPSWLQDFYEESPEVFAMDDAEVRALQRRSPWLVQ
jgi:hypothetical protein